MRPLRVFNLRFCWSWVLWINDLGLNTSIRTCFLTTQMSGQLTHMPTNLGDQSIDTDLLQSYRMISLKLGWVLILFTHITGMKFRSLGPLLCLFQFPPKFWTPFCRKHRTSSAFDKHFSRKNPNSYHIIYKNEIDFHTFLLSLLFFFFINVELQNCPSCIFPFGNHVISCENHFSHEKAISTLIEILTHKCNLSELMSRCPILCLKIYKT